MVWYMHCLCIIYVVIEYCLLTSVITVEFISGGKSFAPLEIVLHALKFEGYRNNLVAIPLTLVVLVLLIVTSPSNVL